MKKKELLQLIQELQQKVSMLEAKIASLQLAQPISVNPYVPFSIPRLGIQEITVCQHEYPSPWMATVPPHCKKCGQQAQMLTFTCQNTGNLLLDPTSIVNVSSSSGN